ncbi:MAG: coenzyme F420-0:L-glutamate ligase [Thaumarchaeota archaeon]|nr:coenzyme F420-0:L-glutamate ligase [Nitrososphaerota archaeon]
MLVGKITLIPFRTPTMKDRFDVANLLLEVVREGGEALRDDDILIVSGKFIAMSEGRIVKLDDVSPSEGARRMAKALEMDESLAELVLQESDEVYRGVPGFALAIRDGIIGPNAGIDRSNVFHGYAILYPKEPFKKAEEMMNRLRKMAGVRIGVIISDSRLAPTRRGTTGVAIGVAGMLPVKDERGREDLFGNKLRYTQRAIADDLCSAAQLLMGEADESVPIVLARYTRVGEEAAPWGLTDMPVPKESLAVKSEECIYMRGLAKTPENFVSSKGTR